MRKLIFHLLLSSLILFCFYGAASAELKKMNYRGDRVVYDTVSDLYWYPYINEFVGKTKAEQIAEIENMDYAGSTEWYMASWFETTLMKQSLAMMAREELRPTAWPIYPEMDPMVPRGASSPHIAYRVKAAKYFTPTGEIPGDGVNPFWSGGTDAYVFNGRTNTLVGGVTVCADPDTGERLLSISNEADDHFVVHGLMFGKPYQTMTFNFDQHCIGDDVIEREGFPGPAIGAWVVTRSIGRKCQKYDKRGKCVKKEK